MSAFESLTADTGGEDVSTDVGVEESQELDTSIVEGQEGDTTTELTERPEWLPEKFTDPTKLAEAYKNLESRFGSFTGAPDGDYDLSFTEELGERLGAEFQFFQGAENGIEKFTGKFKEMGMSQQGVSDLMGLYAEAELERESLLQQQRSASFIEALGGQEQAAKELRTISGNVKGILGEAGQSMLQSVVDGDENSTGNLVKLLKAAFDNKSAPKQLTTQPVDVSTGDYSREELRKMFNSPEYDKDPDFRRKVDAGYAKLLRP